MSYEYHEFQYKTDVYIIVSLYPAFKRPVLRMDTRVTLFSFANHYVEFDDVSIFSFTNQL
jgi:hypothetical protein